MNGTILTLLFIVVLAILAFYTGRISIRTEPRSWWADFWQGISTEMIGAVITTMLFGIVLAVFQHNQDVAGHQQELILQMGSPDNAFAREAVRQLDYFGWLHDGTLYGANLNFANLQSAELFQANLEGVNLVHANLQSANLFQTNLEGAELALSNLQDADLRYANLQGTVLWAANLESAKFEGANLKGANFIDANLKGANFRDALFDNNTLLPDKSRYEPDKHKEQLDRFTDPKHPDFWKLPNAIG